jgi:hypothetical protein
MPSCKGPSCDDVMRVAPAVLCGIDHTTLQFAKIDVRRQLTPNANFLIKPEFRRVGMSGQFFKASCASGRQVNNCYPIIGLLDSIIARFAPRDQLTRRVHNVGAS